MAHNIPKQVRDIIADQLDVKLDALHDGARFREDLGADSLGAVELILAMEQTFSVEISDDESEQIKTVGDMIAFIQRHAR